MLSQYKRKKLTNQNLDEAQGALEEFNQYPLHFLNFYGSTDVAEVMDAIRHAIYEHDIQVICIDNLQFMLSN